MGLACSRVTVLQSRGVKEEIELKEEKELSQSGHYDKTHILMANGRLELPATKFYQTTLDSGGRLVKLKIFIGGRDSGKMLGAHEIKNCAKIVFTMKENELDINRLSCKWFDIRRLWFLGRFRGDDFLEHIMPENKSAYHVPV